MNAVVTQHPRASIIADMAARFGMEPGPFEQTVRATCGGEKLTREQFAAFILVAREHGLNPITREIFAFPGKSGVVPVVSIDGWLRIINSHPQMDGLVLTDVRDGGKLVAVQARIHRKDRAHPIEVTEYLDECDRGTDVWKRWPARMLRHKATIQCARYAFGFAGIYDQDEAERIVEAEEAPLEQKSAYQARKDGDWQRLTAALAAMETVAELETWRECNGADIAKLPTKWQFELSELYEKRAEDIAAAEQADRDAARKLAHHIGESGPTAPF